MAEQQYVKLEDPTPPKSPNPMLKIRSLWPQAVSTPKRSWRVIMVARSAERVDRVFGSNWQRTEIPCGTLTATDLNVPSSLRKLNSDIFLRNSPITSLAKYRTQAVARAIHNRGVIPEVIYCSPALRCIQTAAVFANFFKVRIAVEPGLVDSDMSQVQFYLKDLATHYPIDTTYSQLMTISSIRNEKPTESRRRLKNILQKLTLIKRNSPLLIVAHALAQHSMCEIAHFRETPATTKLCNSNEELSDCGGPTTPTEINIPVDAIDLGLRYPPGSIVSFIQHGKVPNCEYRIIPDMIPPMTYGSLISSNPVLSI